MFIHKGMPIITKKMDFRCLWMIQRRLLGKLAAEISDQDEHSQIAIEVSGLSTPETPNDRGSQPMIPGIDGA